MKHTHNHTSTQIHKLTASHSYSLLLRSSILHTFTALQFTAHARCSQFTAHTRCSQFMAHAMMLVADSSQLHTSRFLTHTLQKQNSSRQHTTSPSMQQPTHPVVTDDLIYCFPTRSVASCLHHHQVSPSSTPTRKPEFVF